MNSCIWQSSEAVSGEDFLLGAQAAVLDVHACLAAHGAHVIDRFAAHKVLGIVAGQLEVGYLFHRIAGGSAADMRVILHGHDRKVAERSTEEAEEREIKVGIRMAARLD